MKTKLTLSVEEALVRYGKRYAQRHRTSVSKLVEAALEQLRRSEEPLFSEKWAGKLVKREHPPGDARMAYLEERYG